MKNPVVGRPLFTQTDDERREYSRPYEVLGNSYGPRFAVVDHDAKTFFFVDGLRGREGYFDLQKDPHALRNMISFEHQQQGEQQIRGFLDALNQLYHYTPVVK